MNLCTNAGQAMEDDGGTLAVSLDRVDLDAAHRGDIAAGAYHRLTVTDTGHGMDRATAERVFEPFFTTKGMGSGTGLGLSVAHGIVTDHGGAIAVHSAAGSGTTFEVLLPVHHGATAEPAAPEHVDTPTGKGRILFVDDEAALVRMAEKVLSKLGYTVLGETDSTAALARFREDPGAIDLVIHRPDHARAHRRRPHPRNAPNPGRYPGRRVHRLQPPLHPRDGRRNGPRRLP